MKNKNVSGVIEVTIPLLNDLSYDGFEPSLGALRLSIGDRNFVIDSYSTDYTNEQIKGGTLTFRTKLFIDKDTFPEGLDSSHSVELNYDLTEEDLASKELVAEFYCGLDDVEDDGDAYDMENAVIECVITVDDKEYVIKTIKFEE